ncbi:MAG: hypothetical protein KatS3mg033_2094 [Thermonema sp.]|jgi:hypothetical protein|uniref:hypothetical protein n=1 Tax=Thermonema TaxID=28194 RepID=UPI000571AE95|nr:MULTISPECIES: hypothetical protein [Thermonema]GIV40294.1 MAG: hypothetical protein KatS3mg033_2094 [Thermonema sp.]
MNQKAKYRLFVSSLVLMLVLTIFLVLFFVLGADYAGELTLGALVFVSIYFIVLAGVLGDEDMPQSSSSQSAQ